MPELPEVETTRRGISPHITGKRLRELVVRNPALRWPVPADLAAVATGHKVIDVRRRGKYLLLELSNHSHLICHLGMSGSLRIVTRSDPVRTHDHIDLVFSNTCILRYHDPRRFGAMLWTSAPPEEHSLLAILGPEPLSGEFTDEFLFRRTRKRNQPIKSAIMDSKLVVGVGNIYANEALFSAGIHPLKAAGKLSAPACERLVTEIKHVLSRAIEQGGTTLRDFVGSDGSPGYFVQQLNVYGRGGEACHQCGKPLTEKRLAQRTTVYCTQCQK